MKENNYDIKKVRNVAIIAHVDHGKTTLVNEFLVQTKTLENAVDRVMDSGEIEKQKGITMLSKCASIIWKDHLINIIDTPGHVDFGSEVERILGTGMVDGVLLIVDALEGIMPQTKTVFERAKENNLKVVVVVNKIDKPGSDPEDIKDMILIDLIEDDEAPVLYASGKNGIAGETIEKAMQNKDLLCILDKIVELIPHPKIEETNDVRASVAMLDHSNYHGKIVFGRLYNGELNLKDKLVLIDENNNLIEKFEVTKLFKFIGINKFSVDKVMAGDIYGLCGSKLAYVNHTIASNINVKPVPIAKISDPMLSVSIGPNKSPLASKTGDSLKMNNTGIASRLLKESYSNLGIRVKTSTNESEIRGRGELQLGILFEQMRREGYEFMLTSARVLYKKINGENHEPLETIKITIPEEITSGGIIRNEIIDRQGVIIDEEIDGKNATIITAEIRTANLFGFIETVTKATKGMAQVSKIDIKYVPLETREKKQTIGLLISNDDGFVTEYAIDKLRNRGIFYVQPGDSVCKGQVIGENNKPEHLTVNIVKGKKLTNMRAAGKDGLITNLPIRLIGMEDIFFLLNLNCNIEITPTDIRIHSTWKY